MLSPPSRRRGLKFPAKPKKIQEINVASLAEAWIEIVGTTPDHKKYWESALEGERVEIPVRERTEWRRKVASLAEAWIEITTGQTTLQTILRRLPRGGVD